MSQQLFITTVVICSALSYLLQPTIGRCKLHTYNHTQPHNNWSTVMISLYQPLWEGFSIIINRSIKHMRLTSRGEIYHQQIDRYLLFFFDNLFLISSTTSFHNLSQRWSTLTGSPKYKSPTFQFKTLTTSSN